MRRFHSSPSETFQQGVAPTRASPTQIIEQGSTGATHARGAQVSAERALGELLEQTPQNEGGGNGSNQHQRATGTQEEPVAKPPTLAEIGISKKQSSRAQKFAAALFSGGSSWVPPEAYNYAAEIKLRAERRLGELLEQMPKQNPGQYKQNSNGTQTVPFEIPPTLVEIGISKKQSSRAQKWACLLALPFG